MSVIVGADGGGSSVKLYGEKGEMIFPSALGEYRERNLDSQFSENDMVFEYQGRKGFAGTLAQYESEFVASMLGDSKAHEDWLIRTLLGLHRYSDDTEFMVVVGQPIKKHRQAEKQKMKQMLEGKHEFTVNGVTKEINVLRAEVAAEGGSAFWSNPKQDKVRIIDFGSGTVNWATLIDGKYIDKDSSTFNFGMETSENHDLASMVRAVCIFLLRKWDADDSVYVCGGSAEAVLPLVVEFFRSAELLRPKVQVKTAEGVSMKYLSPVFANAVAFYNIAKKTYLGGV